MSVALARRTGKTCRPLLANGRLGAAGTCAPKVWRRASVGPLKGGKATWSLRLKRTLPKGQWLAWVRGTDAAGNVEKRLRATNLERFTIR